VLGLLVGPYSFHPPEAREYRLWLRRLYAVGIGVLAVFLVATVAVDWTSLAAAPRIVFTALIGLAAVIVTRLVLAFRLAARRSHGWQMPYVNHIYFTYIALWEGFFIVGLIDLGAPGWLVGMVAVGVLILGSLLVANYKRGLGPESRGRQPAGALR